MLFYLFVLWWSDKFEREPIRYVFYCFIYGAFGAVTLAYIINLLLLHGISLSDNSYSFDSLKWSVIFAPLIEETAKGLFLFTGFIKINVDNLTDGLVYGGAVGLGFGMTENFLYFLSFGTSIESLIILIIIRTIFSAVMHCISTAIFGAFIYIFKFSRQLSKYFFLLMGIVISISIHSTWNLCVTISSGYFYGLFFIMGILVIFIFLYIFSLRNNRNILIGKLIEETDKSKSE
jgi:RsiW-degrading membrane proteinase PrsW (M82 family)